MNEQNFKTAVAFLDAFAWGNRLAYYADETRSFWWITKNEAASLGRMLGERHRSVAYSEWCAAGAGRQVSPRTAKKMRENRFFGAVSTV